MRDLPAIIFDLDGTLVDTSPGILSSLRDAFVVTGVKSVIEFDRSLIGPPLKEMIVTAAPFASSEVVAHTAEVFSEIYDRSGYSKLSVFPGISDFLNFLTDFGFPLHVATNKRIFPTARILALLGWEELFRTVWAIDCVSPAFANKAEMISALMKDQSDISRRFIYIGDRFEDGRAATMENGIPFFHVTWGFEPPLESLTSPLQCILSSPDPSCFEGCLKSVGY